MRENLAIILIILSAVCAQGATLTVDPNGLADYTTIQAAIDDANDGDIVIVHPATYYENIHFNGKNIVLRSTDPNNWLVVDSTVINGGRLDSVVKFSGSETNNCRLSGFTITKGNARYGGGIHGGVSNATIENCQIIDNLASYKTDGYSVAGGGGIIHLNGSIINCIISNNRVSATRTNVSYYNTRAWGGGLSYCNGEIINCIISDNSVNAYTLGNKYVYGGGLFECDATIRNCTIVNNNAETGSSLDSCYGDIINNIIWDNDSDHYYHSATPNYCCIKDWTGSGIGNITEDPLFISGQYFLSPTSPCIDKGHPNQVTELEETDLEGDLRVIGRIDIGADEVFVNDSPALSVFQNDIYLLTGVDKTTTDPFALEIINYGAYSLNWNIEIPNDCNWLIIEPLSGQTESLKNSEVLVSLDYNNIDYGTYHCQFKVVDFNAVNSPQEIDLNVEVIGPRIDLSGTNYYFTAYGKTDMNIPDRQLTITNSGFETLDWHIEIPNDCNWLSVAPQSGQVADGNSIVTLSVEPNKAPQYGYNYCTFQVIDPNASNCPQSVQVRLNVYGPQMEIEPRGLVIYAEENMIGKSTFYIANSGYDFMDWNIETPNDCNWLVSVIPDSGTCGPDQDIKVTVTADSNKIYDEIDRVDLLINSPQVASKYYGIELETYEPNEIHVPYDYLTIQQAVDAAGIGDIVIVHPGKYEGFGISKSALTVQSTAPQDPAVVAATIVESGCRINPLEKDIKIDGLSFIYNPQIPSESIDGITICSSNTQIQNCRIIGFPGSGLYLSTSYSSDEIKINNCGILNNGYHPDCYAGGVYIRRGIVDIANCLIAENTNFGIANPGADYQTIRPRLYVDNCTITSTRPYQNNKYGIYAGWVSDFGGCSLFITNSIIDNATSPNDIEIYYHNDSYITDAVFSVSNTCIPAGQSSIYMKEPNFVNFTYGPDNIETDPCFVMAGYLRDNNTPADINDDRWIEGDYHLKSQYGCWLPSPLVNMDTAADGRLDLADFAVLASEWNETSQQQTMGTSAYYYYTYIRADLDNNGRVDVNDLMIFCDNYLYDYEQGSWVYDDVTSPCIDAGDPNSDWTNEFWPHGKRINMGAYGGTVQASMSPLQIGNPADFDNDDYVNFYDFAHLAGYWPTEQVLLEVDIDRDGIVDANDLALFADNWLWADTQ